LIWKRFCVVLFAQYCTHKLLFVYNIIKGKPNLRILLVEIFMFDGTYYICMQILLFPQIIILFFYFTKQNYKHLLYENSLAIMIKYIYTKSNLYIPKTKHFVNKYFLKTLPKHFSWKNNNFGFYTYYQLPNYKIWTEAYGANQIGT